VPDEATRQEIDKAINRTLNDAGLKDPPFLIKNILEYLDVDREFYDLEDVILLRRFWHKVKVRGQKLVNIVRKIDLHAIWLPDRDQSLIARQVSKIDGLGISSSKVGSIDISQAKSIRPHFLLWQAVHWNGYLPPGEKSIHNPRRTNRTPAPALM